MAQVTDIKDWNPVVASEMKGCETLAEAESKRMDCVGWAWQDDTRWAMPQEDGDGPGRRRMPCLEWGR